MSLLLMFMTDHLLKLVPLLQMGIPIMGRSSVKAGIQSRALSLTLPALETLSRA
ncbi:hypothetical protein [Paracoccus sp. 228]|uniref:hypothetical protein n=1 Tax=Paracoccus sp. 228 TaxID=1192054 RepID=UPI0018DBB9D6|nr:hypothetical protein [Paracoccus sp. 228]